MADDATTVGIDVDAPVVRPNLSGADVAGTGLQDHESQQGEEEYFFHFHRRE